MSAEHKQPSVPVVTGQGRIHRAVVDDKPRGIYRTLCGMYGEIRPLRDSWMRPVSWPRDDAREACKTCERLA